jgi:hypothetical protein
VLGFTFPGSETEPCLNDLPAGNAGWNLFLNFTPDTDFQYVPQNAFSAKTTVRRQNEPALFVS